jgi:Transposase DDE domain group 1
VALAGELTAWLGLLALTDHPARRWEPKRLRLRLFSAAGRLAVSGRRVVLHLSRAGRWSGLLVAILDRLRALPVPAGQRSPPTRPAPHFPPGRGPGDHPSDIG